MCSNAFQNFHVKSNCDTSLLGRRLLKLGDNSDTLAGHKLSFIEKFYCISGNENNRLQTFYFWLKENEKFFMRAVHS